MGVLRLVEPLNTRGRRTSSKINTAFVPQQNLVPSHAKIECAGQQPFRVIWCEATPSNLPVLGTVNITLSTVLPQGKFNKPTSSEVWGAGGYATRRRGRRVPTNEVQINIAEWWFSRERSLLYIRCRSLVCIYIRMCMCLVQGLLKSR